MAGHNGHVAVGEGGAQELLALGRPTCGVGRPQGGPPGAPLGPGSFVTVTNFENLVHVQNLLEKIFKIIFQRILKLRVYFFCKKRKVLEKIQHT